MRRLAIAAFAAGVTSNAIAAPNAWVLNTNTTIDLVNVASNAGVTVSTTPFPSDSLALTNTGRLISAAGNGSLWDVTGAPIPVGATGKTQIGDLDYANGGLWGYSNFSQELFFYDLGLATVTYSQAIAIPTAFTVTGVAFEQATGDIYLSAFNNLNNDKLLKVASMATSATVIGNMANGDAFSYFSDIDFDASGNLVAMSFFHRYFYTVSTSTAATTFLSAGPHKDTTAMALNPVPEPGSIAIAVFTAACIARRRRGR